MKEEENKLQSQLAQQREECKETECEKQHYENHQILYNVGEGSRVSFWHDPWCGPTPLKELFPTMYACSLSKEEWLPSLVVTTSEGGRS